MKLRCWASELPGEKMFLPVLVVRPLRHMMMGMDAMEGGCDDGDDMHVLLSGRRRHATAPFEPCNRNCHTQMLVR